MKKITNCIFKNVFFDFYIVFIVNLPPFWLSFVAEMAKR